ncbi:hypothetical protein Agub_g5673, partial [Astrephomene gubernaculifera]
MSSCSYLDPASLLAQRAVSVRLGRRASGCSHSLFATNRRAPLSDSSVQGSTKQASSSTSAPTRVLPAVSVDEPVQQNDVKGSLTIHELLSPVHVGPRRRASAACHDSTVHIPPIRFDDSAGQPPPESLTLVGAYVEKQVQEVEPQHQHPRPGHAIEEDVRLSRNQVADSPAALGAASDRSAAESGLEDIFRYLLETPPPLQVQPQQPQPQQPWRRGSHGGVTQAPDSRCDGTPAVPQQLQHPHARPQQQLDLQPRPIQQRQQQLLQGCCQEGEEDLQARHHHHHQQSPLTRQLQQPQQPQQSPLRLRRGWAPAAAAAAAALAACPSQQQQDPQQQVAGRGDVVQGVQGVVPACG